RITHRGTGLFAGVASPLTATRYHSLVVAREGLPPELEVTATSDDGLIMALRHRCHPVLGVQFHPESIFTPDGKRLLANFLAFSQPARIAGARDNSPAQPPATMQESQHMQSQIQSAVQPHPSAAAAKPYKLASRDGHPEPSRVRVAAPC